MRGIARPSDFRSSANCEQNTGCIWSRGSFVSLEPEDCLACPDCPANLLLRASQGVARSLFPKPGSGLSLNLFAPALLRGPARPFGREVGIDAELKYERSARVHVFEVDIAVRVVGPDVPLYALPKEVEVAGNLKSVYEH